MFRRVAKFSGVSGETSARGSIRSRKKMKPRARREVSVPRRGGVVSEDSSSSGESGEKRRRSPPRGLSSKKVLGQRGGGKRSQNTHTDVQGVREGARRHGGGEQRSSSRALTRRRAAASDEDELEGDGEVLHSSSMGEDVLGDTGTGISQMRAREEELAAMLAAAVRHREREERRAKEREEAERRRKEEEETRQREEARRREEQRRRDEAQARRASRQQSQSSTQSQGRVPPSPSRLSQQSARSVPGAESGTQVAVALRPLRPSAVSVSYAALRRVTESAWLPIRGSIRPTVGDRIVGGRGLTCSVADIAPLHMEFLLPRWVNSHFAVAVTDVNAGEAVGARFPSPPLSFFFFTWFSSGPT